MASIRTTINKTQDGKERIHFGTATLLNATTTGTIQTDLYRVDCFIMSHCDHYTEVDGVVTANFLDPAATEVVGWMAIGL